MASHIRIGNAESQLNRLRQNDLERRQSGAATILRPEVIAGKATAHRLLYTTLGGTPQPITKAHLAAFRARIAEVGGSVQAGMSIAEALSLSRPTDRERAAKEIRYAAPTQVLGAEVRFLTDSGPHSKVTRHHTRVEFVDWSAAIARPGTALQAAAALCRDSKLRFECQCEAFTFWGYRYLATIGNYVLGREEIGFPKVRCPDLNCGPLCKHLVRTMVTLQSDMLLRRRVAESIEQARRRLDVPGTRAKPKPIRFTQAEADRLTSAPARRIVVQPGQRGAKLPPPASAADIQTALKAFAGKHDANSLAIAHALQNLLTAQQKAARP